MALDFDSLTATTLKNYRPTLTDNIFNGHPLLFWLKDKKRVRFLSGGEKIVEPLAYTEGDLVQMYSDYDAISITPVETATAAEFEWRQLAGTIAISGAEELKNSGPEQVVNLLEAKIMQTEETIKNSLSSQLFTPASSVGAKSIHSLDQLINNYTGYNQPVGGIAAADGSGWWESVYQDKTAVAAAAVDLRAFVRNAYNTASKGGTDRVDIVISGQTAFEQYEADLLPTVRRVHQKMADAGFQNLEVQGVPWVWDYNCPQEKIFGIASKYLGLVGHKNRWFKQSKFTEGLAASDGGVATTVDARYSIITAMLNLTVRNRRRHFQIDNINFS